MNINDCLNQYFNHLKKTCPELILAEFEQFSTQLTISELDKNEIYIEQGKVQKQGGFVIKGLIREFYTDELGNEKTMNFVSENEYAFNYPTYMEKEPSPFSYQCLEPTTIINFPINHIQQTYQELPIFEQYGRLRSEKRAKKQRKRLKDLLSKTAEQRYIDFIEENPALFQRITISHLASYLGVERQTLTKIRKQIITKK